MEASSGSGYLISGRPLAFNSVAIILADSITREYFHRVRQRRQFKYRQGGIYVLTTAATGLHSFKDSRSLDRAPQTTECLTNMRRSIF